MDLPEMKDLYVWIISSTRTVIEERFKELNTRKRFIYFEGDAATKAKNANRIEVRIDMPLVKKTTAKELKIKVEVNILVITFDDKDDNFAHERDIGVAAQLLVDDIAVSQLGSKDSTGAFVGCLQLNDDGVQIQNFGLVDPSLKMQRATAEAHFVFTYY